jgi:hypothetical protein
LIKLYAQNIKIKLYAQNIKNERPGGLMMSQRLFIVYRERPDSAPKAIDAMADVTEANRIIGLFDWYGAIADTPEEAIKEFEEYEKSKHRH